MVNNKPLAKAGKLYKTTQSIINALAVLLALATSPSCFADSTLHASVDRNQLYINETFTLTLTGNVDIDFSFGGLMGFGRKQIEAPLIEGLEDSFEILDRQQNYSMRSINGDTTTEVTWNYSLRPKKSGQLSIPPANLNSAQSQAIVINVLTGNAPINADNPPAVFIEVEVDKNEVYVQEQVIFTVRLFALGRLSSGSLNEPQSSDAIVEVFGEEKKYYRMAYNQRYEVIERNYLIFPQKSGALEIEPLVFNGTLIDSYQRRRLRISEASEPLKLEVKAPNPEFTGEHWLPAKSLYLSETWQEQNAQLHVGDALTREIEVSALGLLGSALPPSPEINNDAVKTYPDKAKVASNLHEGGALATRTESTTYIAIKEGQIVLPEIRIPWWDTVNGVERVATLPKRHINVINGASSQAKQDEASVIDHVISEPISSATSVDSKPQSGGSYNLGGNHGLLSLIALLVFGWLITSGYLLKKLNNTKRDLAKLVQPQSPEYSAKNLDLGQLTSAIKQHSADLPKMVIAWVALHSQANAHNNTYRYEAQPLTLDELKQVDESIASQLIAFEEEKYRHNGERNYDPDALVQALKKYQKKQASNVNHPPVSLRPFYP